MPASVIMPALELAQETGKVLRWLKAPGDTVAKGEPIVEIETDKVTVEIEAPASGVLREVTAGVGDVVPVGKTVALICAAGEAGASAPAAAAAASAGAGVSAVIKASPLARKLAEQHGVDLTRITTPSGRIEKADVMAYVESQQAPAGNGAAAVVPAAESSARLVAASPKARRLAGERGVDLRVVRGSGPGGAVLAGDVAAAKTPAAAAATAGAGAQGVSNIWRIMAERMTSSWTTAPHFYLVREVNVSRLASWLQQARKQTGAHVTYTDLLVRLVAAAIARNPAVNGSWRDGTVVRNADITIRLARPLDAGR